MKAVTKVLAVSLLAVGFLWVAGTALAQYPPPPDCPDSARPITFRGPPSCPQGEVDPAGPTVVLPQTIERDPGVLAVTGADLTRFVIIGSGAILLGTILVRRFRSTHPA